jgi:HsdM N-terminal domain/N-6 DNA Methylase
VSYLIVFPCNCLGRISCDTYEVDGFFLAPVAVRKSSGEPSGVRAREVNQRGMMSNRNGKSLEFWIWDAACSIRGAPEAPKFKDFILPLIFTKRLCDVFDDELNWIAREVGSRAKAFKLVERDHKLVRFYLPIRPEDPGEPAWSVIRKLTGTIGETLTMHLHEIAKANPALAGVIDRMDFNATTHGQRDIDDDRLSNLIERIIEKRVGLRDVEADIYEYPIRKFAEGSGQSAGEFFTPGLKVLFKNKIEQKASEYLTQVTHGFNDKDRDDLIEHFRDKDRRNEYFKESRSWRCSMRAFTRMRQAGGESPRTSLTRRAFYRAAPRMCAAIVLGAP